MSILLCILDLADCMYKCKLYKFLESKRFLLQVSSHYSLQVNSFFFFLPTWLLLLEDDDAASNIDVSPDVGPTIKANASAQMEAAIGALSGELNKLRTGRASPGTLLCAIAICYLFAVLFWFSDLLARLFVECLCRDA